MPLPALIAGNLLPLGALAPMGSAPGSPLGGAPSAAAPVPAAYSLSFIMQPQEDSNWCWAAVGISVAQFYNSATSWSSQCDLASKELGKTCCPAKSNPACDVPWYLDKSLARVGHLKGWAGGSQPLAVIRAEIDATRPLEARIGWSGGGGHFVALSGYSTFSAGDFVTVEDPIFGRSTMPLSAFVSSYQGSGTWTHSYWTRP